MITPEKETVHLHVKGDIWLEIGMREATPLKELWHSVAASLPAPCEMDGGWGLQKVAQCDHGSHTTRPPVGMGVGVYSR